MLKNETLRALTLLFLVFSSLLGAQDFGFVPNEGQWSGDFDFRLRQGENYIFLKATEQRVLLLEGQDLSNQYHHPKPTDFKAQKGHAYRLKWLGVNEQAKPIKQRILSGQPYLNFLLGNNPSKWASNVYQYGEIVYQDIYQGIDLRYYLSEDHYLKYDFIIHPGADPGQIKWSFEGVEDQGLAGEDIALLTSMGTSVYTKPMAFQGGIEVPCSFHKEASGLFTFSIGEYDSNEKLVIDPTLIFSTYSGSTDDNFGLTATYGANEMAYGAGVNFFTGVKKGFPTTLGALQDSSLGGITDVSIAKYTADGTAQVYATYLGGVGADVPFSLLEGPNKSLIILGATTSGDFPVTSSAYDTSFAGGPGGFHRLASGFSLTNASDIFLTVLDSTGGNLVGSTLLGDTMRDGVNQELEFNYGDGSRGDITIDANNNILISSFTQSSNLNSSGTNTSFGGLQDGLVASFNSDLSQLNWLTYIGGESNDAVFSLRYTPSNRLFITGATESDSISTDTIGVYQAFRAGQVDAFLAELNPLNGQVLRFTYSGTPLDDISYFLDLNPQGNLVIFGQTYSLQFPMVGDSVWGQFGNPHFFQEFSEDLGTLQKSTTFGKGPQGIPAISPTALLVSDCGDIFASGWSAGYPSDRGFMGRPANMPTTPDAYRDSADRGDFYLLRLDASWQRLEYATYFGQVGGGLDHVDGGSSRFRKDGSVFQAVCSCGQNPSGFPTTPNAFAATKGSNNCNMAVFRFDMEADTIRADVRLLDGISDTLCLPDSVSFIDFSFNADLVFFRQNNGSVDTLHNGYIPILDSGKTTFHFIALDTNCSLVDSISIDVFAKNEPLMADFDITYDSCDASGAVQVTNLSSGATNYQWVVNNGDTLRMTDLQLNLPPSNYDITLIAEDRLCSRFDTLVKSLKVREILDFTRFEGDWDPCDPERKVSFEIRQRGFQNFNWSVDGSAVGFNADTLAYRFDAGGFYIIQLQINDTVCNRSRTFEQEVYFYDEDFSIQFPNVFTPNGDLFNDEFRVLDSERLVPILEKSQIEIYNRNGTLLFSGDFLSEAWDGKFEGQELPAGVYFYVFDYEDICGQKSTDKGFVHLQR